VEELGVEVDNLLDIAANKLSALDLREFFEDQARRLMGG
jgi:uncharacterized protein YfdQ (DUF2303 family)